MQDGSESWKRYKSLILNQKEVFLSSQTDNQLEDAVLVLRAQKGDGEVFSGLLTRYRDRIYATLYGLTGDRDVSEDLLQDVSIKAHLSINRFRGDSQFYTWLYRVAVNRWKDWRISMSRKREDVIEGVFERTAGRSRTDDATEQGEIRAMLAIALQELPDMWRQVIVLREIDDLSYDEIAEVLTCSIGTVKSRLFRARGRLREILVRDYPEFETSLHL